MYQHLDSQIVEELNDIMGDDIGALFETFVMDSENKIDELSQIKVSEKGDAVRRLAHSLKGSCRNVGANELADQCELLEKAARAGDFEVCERLKGLVSQAFLEVKREISAIYLMP